MQRGVAELYKWAWQNYAEGRGRTMQRGVAANVLRNFVVKVCKSAKTEFFFPQSVSRCKLTTYLFLINEQFNV